jgi:predicted AlkP superfamily pyrophosphatase or phosphodiesterase
MGSKLLLLMALLLCAASVAPAPHPAPPQPKITRAARVLIISVDGLRPDVMLRADAPHMRSLLAAGSFSLFARTIPFAYTLPSHVSMLTGASPEKHGVTWNNYIEQSYPNVPTLFDLAHAKGLTTAIAVAKMKFVVLDRPGALDWKFIANEDKQTDADVGREAAALIAAHQPQVMFVHFAAVDVVGHDSGWGSAQQIDATAQVDAQVGVVLEALRKAKVFDQTLIILTSDHGGGGRGHGPDDLTSALIPWVAVGPGVRKNFDLTLLRGQPVKTTDTFATACAVLGLEAPADTTEGRPVMGMFAVDELVHDLPAW